MFDYKFKNSKIGYVLQNRIQGYYRPSAGNGMTVEECK